MTDDAARSRQIFEQARLQGCYPLQHDWGSPLGVRMPEHVKECPAHREIWLGWRNNRYDLRRPSEWPGTPSGIMDSRTSHEERAYGWAEKNAAQMELVAGICGRGTSPQCSRGQMGRYCIAL
ncbi:hypothetical protein [Streptomyces sp. TLI_171]|uniref:hypothetical protein n=1 Tax=Streptomyces sp. TLI_171 TaxID=1938859 RepID=UPI000C1881E4|nr:hypothetical protein [Streptomyces sp. TLI_171]RKE02999.1 hypothetical protein BX266_7606 [Streptomyces sp. TLI_171]